ncbi:FadR family transcriptional regulator [Naumannella sp. ID2617S]|nr:FadR family transcriptional regulator [Naumannella sp. ID2617S]
MSQAPLTERIATELGARIVNEELRPGSVLLLEELGAEFGVSRTVAREAVKLLESHQLVTSRRRVGVQVQPPGSWSALSPFVLRARLAGPRRLEQLEAISQLRRGVEPIAAGLAAVHASDEQQQALVGAALGMAQTGRVIAGALPDLQAYLAHDVVFHRTLLIASGNPLMASLADIIEEVLTARTNHHLMPPVPNPDAIRLHRQVALAIADGDAVGAEQAMCEIVDEARAAVATMAREPGR